MIGSIRAPRRHLAVSVTLLVPILLLSSCIYGSDLFGVSNTRHSAEEDFSYSIDVTTQAGFLLQGINGTVELEGDPDATTVEVWGTRKVKSESVADARQHLDDLLVLVHRLTVLQRQASRKRRRVGQGDERQAERRHEQATEIRNVECG